MKKESMPRPLLMTEVKKVQEFLKSWRESNPYNGNLQEHNEKFQKDSTEWAQANGINKSKYF